MPSLAAEGGEREREPMKCLTNSEAETEALGGRLARLLQRRSVVACFGGLGAGKTAFIRGLARGLGVEQPVTSPTFTIVNEYAGRLPLFHFDLYRLGGPEELFDIGWEEYLDRGGICAVEWSERAADALGDCIRVEFSKGESDGQRVIEISGGGLKLEDFSH